MEGKVNYTVAGIFVVVMTILLLTLIFWLTAFSSSTQYKSYLLFVHEDVTGLSIDGPVRFNGVQVGFVKSIHLDEHNQKLVRLLLQIHADVPITTSTYAMLNAQGITGVIYVNLKAGSQQAPLLRAQAGQRFPIIPAKPSLLMQLSSVLPEVTKDIHQLSSSLAQVFDQKNQEAISGSLQNIHVFTKTLADNSGLIEKNLTELHKTLSHLSLASKGLPALMGSINKTSKRLAKTAGKINQMAVHGNMAIANFTSQVLPSAQQAIGSFHAATQNFNQFLGELKHNPSMLVRGKRPDLLGPGE